MPDIPGFSGADGDRGDPRSGPLKGIRALDFGVAAAGPFALAWMATLGADVIKIERPTGDHIRHMPPLKHEVSTTFLICSVGKRGVALDLKNEAQREQVLALIRSADVALDNFRGPEVMER